MARLTAQQIAQMTPDISALLANQGIFISGENDDGSPRYVNSEGDRVSQGQVNELMQGGELPDFQAESLRNQGILGLGGSAMQDTLNSEYFNQGGQRFSTPVDYFNYLYGGKGEQVGDYYVLPEGMSYDQYTNAPLRYEPPTPLSTQLALLAIGGLATGGAAAEAGLFGGAGAGAGAGAAAEAAPTFVGGASGAGIAGGAAGGGTLSGLTAAEMAALGAGGAGAAAGGGGSGLNVADFITQGTGSVGVPPAIPGVGNGVGLTEAAMAGLKGTSGTALSRIWDQINGGGDASSADWLDVLGKVGGTGLGLLGANAQGDAYADVADKYLALGAPYRQKLEASYAPGFSMADQPDFMNALDLGAQAAARATSARSGNPVDNPGAYSEMQKYISGSLALPQLNTYRSQLGSFGQLGTNTAGTNDTAAAGQVGGTYDAIGSGLRSLTKPQNPYEDMMKGLMGQQFKLNQGFSF